MVQVTYIATTYCGISGQCNTRVLQERLGHSNIRNTTRYAELTGRHFEDAGQQEN
jgi:hypothetical protein